MEPLLYTLNVVMGHTLEKFVAPTLCLATILEWSSQMQCTNKQRVPDTWLPSLFFLICRFDRWTCTDMSVCCSRWGSYRQPIRCGTTRCCCLLRLCRRTLCCLIRSNTTTVHIGRFGLYIIIVLCTTTRFGGSSTCRQKAIRLGRCTVKATIGIGTLFGWTLATTTTTTAIAGLSFLGIWTGSCLIMSLAGCITG